MDFKLGTAKVDITPESAVQLAGFAHRIGEYNEVVDPLFLRIFYFNQESSPDENRSIILVTADLIWWDWDITHSLRDKLSQRYGIEKAGIVFHATHNHSGPQTSKKFSRFLGEADGEYIAYLETQLLKAVEKAKSNLETIQMERESIDSDLGINRRKLRDGKIKMSPNKEGIIDNEVVVIRFRKKAGDTKAVFIHYACHPTISGSNTVTSEFPGICTNVIEHSLGQDCLAGYFQGCSGDIRPNLVKDEEFYSGSHEDIVKYGGKLAYQVLEILKSDKMIPLKPAKLEFQEIEVPLEFDKVTTETELKEINKNESGVMKEWSETLLNNSDMDKHAMPLHLNLVKISDGLAFLAMDAEMVVEYGLFIKEQFSGNVLPLPYSNGMIGYVPTARQIKEGGYEAEVSTYYFGLPSTFSSSIEAAIHRSIKNFQGEGVLH